MSIARTRDGRFVKGAGSPNPGGKPKDAGWLAEELRKDLPTYVMHLYRVATDTTHERWADAIKLVFGYAVGKPQEKVEITGGVHVTFDVASKSEDELRLLLKASEIIHGSGGPR